MEKHKRNNEFDKQENAYTGNEVTKKQKTFSHIELHERKRKRQFTYRFEPHVMLLA